jgi:hypothetical protein
MMTKTIQAIFDGKVLHPEEPLPLEPNTRVQLTLEVPPTPAAKPMSFLETAASLKLQGPADWSERLDHYLYGDLLGDTDGEPDR